MAELKYKDIPKKIPELHLNCIIYYMMSSVKYSIQLLINFGSQRFTFKRIVL